MGGCNIGYLGEIVTSDSASYKEKVNALNSIIEDFKSGCDLSEGVFHKLEAEIWNVDAKLDLQLIHFFSQVQSSHKISPNTVSYLEEVLADGERLRDISKIFSNSKQNIVLQESTYNSIVNLLNNNAIEEKVRENFASILPKWIVKSEALSNQVFDAIGKCYSNKKLPVLSKACQKILITVAEAENATSRSMELLGNSFKRPEVPYLLKDLARKKDLKLSIASAKLICKSLSNATTSTKLQSVLSDTLEKQILSGSIHLEDIAEDLEELLLGDPHAKYVINLIKAVQKQQMAIPSRLLIALSRVIVKNLGKKGYPCDDALKIIYVEGAKALLDGAVFSNLETALMGDTVRSDNNVYRLTVAIFVQASSKIKISSNAIAYFEKSLNKNYKRFVEECQEWIDISEIGEDEKVVSTERVCAHDMSEDAVLEDMDKKINSEQIESILELLGFQVTDHGLSLKPHSISNLVYLTYEKQISNDGRNNANVILTVLINRGITISDVALQDLNKGLVTILESSSKNSADEKLVYDALPVLAVAVKEWNLQPHPILLKHFERLLESKNYKLGIYGIESILKLQESLSISDTNFKLVETLLDGKLTLDGTRSAINLLSYNLRNLKKTFDVSGLETLKKFIGQEELREALLSALMVHASNKGVISNQILALIILKYEISKVIDLLYEVSKHYEVKDQQILDLLGKYLIDTNSDKAFGILQKNKAKLGMDLQSILLQEEFVRNANNTAPVVFLKKIKEQGSKLTRRFLLNLEEFLKGEISTEESNEALGIVNYALKNKQKLTDGLISILLDKAVDKLDLIERIFDERAYSTEKLFHYLSKIFTLKSMDHKDVRKVVGLLSRILKSEDFSVKEITEALIDKLISTIKDNGDRNLSLDIIFFFKGLASKAGVVPESFFDETRKFLFSKDNGIRNKMLDLYNEVSINHEVSLEDLKSLFAILNLEDVGEKVFKILENFNEISPFENIDSEKFAVGFNIFNFRKTKSIHKKAEAIISLGELLDNENVKELAAIFKVGLSYKDKRIRYASIHALSKATNLMRIKFTHEEIHIIAKELERSDIRKYSIELIASISTSHFFERNVIEAIARAAYKEKDRNAFDRLVSAISYHCNRSADCSAFPKHWRAPLMCPAVNTSNDELEYLYYDGYHKHNGETLQNFQRALEEGFQLAETELNTLSEMARSEKVVAVAYQALLSGHKIPGKLIQLLLQYKDAGELLSLIMPLSYEKGIFKLCVSKLSKEIKASYFTEPFLRMLQAQIEKGLELEDNFIMVLENLVVNEGKEEIIIKTLTTLAVKGHYEPSEKFLNHLLSKTHKDFHEGSLKDKLWQVNDKGKLAYILYSLSRIDFSFEIESVERYPREIYRWQLYGTDVDSYALRDFETAVGYPEFSYERDEVLKFLQRWGIIHSYTISEVNKVLDLLVLSNYWEKKDGRHFMNKVLSDGIYLSLEQIEDLWLEDKLAGFLPNVILDKESLLEIKGLLRAFDFKLRARILDSVKGIESIEDFKELKGFLSRYNINDEILAATLITTIKLGELYEDLKAIIIRSEVIKKFSNINIETLIKVDPNIRRLISNKWELDELLKLINSGRDSEGFFKLIEMISIYNTPAEATNSKGETIWKLLKTCKKNECIKKLTSLAKEYNFLHKPVARRPIELLREISELNSESPAIVELVTDHKVEDESGNVRREDSYIKTILKQVDLLEKGKEKSFFNSRKIVYRGKDPVDNVVGIIKSILTEDEGTKFVSKPISEWNEEDILAWRHNISPRDVKWHLPEVIAVIKRAVFLANKFVPRDIQIMSVLLLYKSHKEILAQIATGEGKSLIVAMSAIIKSLEGYRPDIITSSSVLAKKDAKNQAPLFALFDLTVGENTGPISVAKREQYEKNIVFGDVASFIGDLLAHEFHGMNIRGDRKLELVMVDEVDSMLIDESSNTVRLTDPMPSFEFLEPLLAAIWQYWQLTSRLIVREESNLYWVEKEREMVLLKENVTAEEELEYKKEFLISEIKSLLNQDGESKLEAMGESILPPPPHLQKFVLFQIERWVNSAIRASQARENVEYVIGESKKEVGGKVLKEIKIVNFENTGVTQEGMNWSDGLHQFLQIKHGLQLTPEALSTIFMSNICFFKRYNGNIIGMTGTLGGKSEKRLLKGIYGVEFLLIPTFIPKRFVSLPGIVAQDGEWLEEILASIQQETASGRAVLVISRTIEESKQIRRVLLTAGFPIEKLRDYTRSDTHEKWVVEKPIDAGEVVLATNLAGRGTDLGTTTALEKNGGLHVLISYLTLNLRVWLQAEGRTARNGNFGTSQVIMKIGETSWLRARYPWYEGRTMEEIVKWRDLVEEQRLLHDEYRGVFSITLKDKLFEEFQAFIHELKKKKQGEGFLSKLYRMIWNKPQVTFEEDQVREVWGMWVKQYLDTRKEGFRGRITPQDKPEFDRRNAKEELEIRAKFNELLDSLREEFDKDELIKNPSFYVKRGLKWNSMEDLNKAVNLSGPYSFAAYYAKARIYTNEIAKMIVDEEGNYDTSPNAYGLAAAAREDTSTTGNKDTRVTIIEGALVSLYSARQVLNDTMIPLQNGFISLTNITTPEQKTSQLVQKIQRTIALYESFMNYIDKAVTILESSGNMNVGLSSTVGFKEAVGGTEEDDEKEELQGLGVDNFFTLYLYEPEEIEQDFFGSFFVALAGFVQIFIGAMLVIGTGGLAAKLGVAMIASGVSDIIAAVRAVIQGYSIDLHAWLSSKGITYLITAITIGINNLIDKVTAHFPRTKAFFDFIRGIKGGTKEATAIEIIQTTIRDQLIIEGISALGQLWGGKMLRDNKAEIERKIRKSVAEMLSERRNELNRIFAAEAFSKSNDKKKALVEISMRFLKDNERLYQESGRKIAEGVARGVFRKEFDYALTAAEVAQSIDKIYHTTNDFCSAFSIEIRNIASSSISSGTMMEQLLSVYKDILGRTIFQAANIVDIMKYLMKSGLVLNGVIACGIGPKRCGGIAGMNLYSFNSSRAMINASCQKACNIASADYSKEITEFQNGLVNLLTNSIMRMIRGEIIDPVSGLAARFLLDLYKKQQEAAEKAKEAIKKLNNDHQEAAPKPEVKPEEGKDKTKPIPQSKQKSALSLSDQMAMDSFIDNVEKDPSHNHERAKVLSRILNRPLEIDDGLSTTKYDENMLRRSKSVGGKSDPIKLRYDSVSKTWESNYIGGPSSGGLHNFGPRDVHNSIYAAVARSQPGFTKVLQKSVVEEIRTNPTQYLRAAQDYRATTDIRKRFEGTKRISNLMYEPLAKNDWVKIDLKPLGSNSQLEAGITFEIDASDPTSIKIKSNAGSNNSGLETLGDIVINSALEWLDKAAEHAAKQLPAHLKGAKVAHVLKIKTLTFKIEYLMRLGEARERYGEKGIEVYGIALAQTLLSRTLASAGGVSGKNIGRMIGGLIGARGGPAGRTAGAFVGGKIGEFTGGVATATAYDEVYIADKPLNYWVGDSMYEFFRSSGQETLKQIAVHNFEQ